MKKNHQPKRRSILKRTALYTVLSILVLLLLFLALSPRIARNYLNNHGKELSGRALHIDKIKLNYFTSTLQVIGGKMYEQNDSDIFVAFDTLLIDLQPLRLLKHELKVQQFLVSNLQAQIMLNDSVFNFNDLMEFYSSDGAAAEDSTSSSFKLNLNQIAIKNGQLSYTDQELNHTLSMQHISFSIPHVYWGGATSKADIAFDIGNGGHVNSTFNYNMAQERYSGNVKLSGFTLEMLLPYIQQYMNFSRIAGLLDADINLNGSVSTPEDFTIDGKMSVSDVLIDDPKEKKVLGVTRADATISQLKPLLYEARLEQVNLEAPYMHLMLMDSLFNFEHMMVNLSDETTETTTQDSTADNMPYNVFIGRIEINQGLMDFSDHRFAKPFHYELSEIEMRTDSVSLNSDWLEVNATMKLNKRGTLTATLGVDPGEPFRRIDLDYVLSDFQLPDINIYSEYYTGLPILFGEMYYVGKTRIVNHQLNSNNELVIRDVQMGRKTRGLYNVPIKLALFILKDINGDISLNIPVTGDLSDPRTRIGTIVWNTFKGFMGKIVASPFKAIGNLLGSDPAEVEQILFSYGDSTLTRKQRRSLDLLLKLEELKPELAIYMQYLNDRKLERSDAAAQIVQQSFEAKYQKNPLNHFDDYQNYLQEETGKDSLMVADYEFLLAPKSKVNSVIMLREQQRLQGVKNYLHSQNDSTTIQILPFNREEALNHGSRPQFAISYKLKEEDAAAE